MSFRTPAAIVAQYIHDALKNKGASKICAVWGKDTHDPLKEPYTLFHLDGDGVERELLDIAVDGAGNQIHYSLSHNGQFVTNKSGSLLPVDPYFKRDSSSDPVSFALYYISNGVIGNQVSGTLRTAAQMRPIFQANASDIITDSGETVQDVLDGSATFKTIEELKASKAPEGSTAKLEERAMAEYTIKSNYPPKKGDITLDNGNVAVLNTGLTNDIRWFGVVGDKSTDDSDAFQDASERGLQDNLVISAPSFLKINIEKEVDVGDVDIISPAFSSGFNGDMAEIYLVGNHKGLVCTPPKRFKLRGLKLFGTGEGKHANQDGLFQYPSETFYESRSHILESVHCQRMGRDGVNLSMGLELSNLTGLFCSYNGRDGLHVGRTDGTDSATDYINIDESKFTYNVRNGVFFEHLRKHLSVTKTDLSGNGRYDINDCPAEADKIVAGVHIESASLDLGEGTMFNVECDTCYGEQMGTMLHINTYNNPGESRNVRLINNIQFPAPNVENTPGDKAAMLYLDVKSMGQITTQSNEARAVYLVDASARTSLTSLSSNEPFAQYSPEVEKKVKNYSYRETVNLKGERHTRSYSDWVGSSDRGGAVGTQSISFNTVSAFGHNTTLPNTITPYVSTYQLVVSQPPANTITVVMCFVAKTALGYCMTTIKGDDAGNDLVSGPTIDPSTGDISIQIASYRHARLQRIDNLDLSDPTQLTQI